MDKETKEGYEPNRIPLSVFAATMTPKQEWSIQSNESLFSIQMGDQSFSKMYKSGELSSVDFTPSYINNYNISDNKITLTDYGTKEVNVEAGQKTTNPGGLTNAPKPDQPKPIPVSPTKSYRSDDASNNSAVSFAFPTLNEYQQDRKITLNTNNESRKREISRGVSKPNNGGGWITCFSCFPVKN